MRWHMGNHLELDMTSNKVNLNEPTTANQISERVKNMYSYRTLYSYGMPK